MIQRLPIRRRGMGQLSGATDYFYGALTAISNLGYRVLGKLSPQEMAEIQAQVNADIDRAAGGNTVLAAQQKAQFAQELQVLKAQAEPSAGSDLVQWGIIGGAVLLGIYLWTRR